MRGLLAQSLATASFDGKVWTDPKGSDGSHAGDFINWLAFGDLAESVVVDVERIRTHPLVPDAIPIHGFIYDVATGQLIEVPAATERGRATVA
jgi:carbonic anhydrase